MPALTGLRGLCALWVLVYHAWAYATPREIIFSVFGEPIRFHVFLSLGWSGVQALFVLSAFLLTIPYARANAGLSPKPRTFSYIIRRVARVFPAYYLQLFLLLCISWFVSQRLVISPSQLPHFLLMLFTPPPVGVGSPVNINGVWWTLPIELSFYLLLPLIAWLASWRWKSLLLLLCLASMIGWRYYVLSVINPDQKHLWVAQLPGSMDSFGLGMLGAVIHVQYTQVRSKSKVYSRTLLALLCATPLVLIFLGRWMAELYETYWTVSTILFSWTLIFNLAVLIVVLNCANNQFFLPRVLSNRLLFYLGTVSYGVYLWHAPIGKWLQKLTWIDQMEGYQFPRLAVAMFLLSLLAATFSWFLVEKKAIALTKRSSSKTSITPQ